MCSQRYRPGGPVQLSDVDAGPADLDNLTSWTRRKTIAFTAGWWLTSHSHSPSRPFRPFRSLPSLGIPSHVSTHMGPDDVYPPCRAALRGMALKRKEIATRTSERAGETARDSAPGKAPAVALASRRCSGVSSVPVAAGMRPTAGGAEWQHGDIGRQLLWPGCTSATTQVECDTSESPQLPAHLARCTGPYPALVGQRHSRFPQPWPHPAVPSASMEPSTSRPPPSQLTDTSHAYVLRTAKPERAGVYVYAVRAAWTRYLQYTQGRMRVLNK